MTIKDWLVQYMSNNQLAKINKLKQLNYPEVLLKKELNKYNKLMSGKLSISHIDKNSNMDLFKVALNKVQLVCGVRGGNVHLLFNDNIHLYKCNKFTYLKQEYKEVIIKQVLYNK